MRWAGAALTSCGLAALGFAAFGGQGTAPARTFRAGSEATFRVELTVRSELEGSKTSTVGGNAYVQPVSGWVEEKLAWSARRRIASIDADGAAEITEELSAFSDQDSAAGESADSKKMLDDLGAGVKQWETQRTLHYRETPSGEISGLGVEAAPPVGEPGPRILTAWLLRALRPTTALPAHPIVYDRPWQEQRAVRFAEWTDASGSESGEWLAGSADFRARGEAAVQLHATQEISAKVTAGGEKPTEGTATANFHAESLSTLALEDLRLRDAQRSAVREVVWKLAPVAGLAQPPEFRARLMLEIRIQSCDETPCNSGTSDAGRNRR